MEDLKQPEQVINEVEGFDKAQEDIIDQIIAKEREKLDTVFMRFCIKYCKAPDYSRIKPKLYPDRKNYTEYYYRHSNGTMYLLMSAEVGIVNNVPMLELLPNKELAFNDEI